MFSATELPISIRAASPRWPSRQHAWLESAGYLSARPVAVFGGMKTGSQTHRLGRLSQAASPPTQSDRSLLTRTSPAATRFWQARVSRTFRATPRLDWEFTNPLTLAQPGSCSREAH